jgi:hypothetical protein
MNLGLKGPSAASLVLEGAAGGGPVNLKCDRKKRWAELSLAKGWHADCLRLL